jgi:hypothetical protein
VGENEDDDGENEGERTNEPDGRTRENACLRGRHRALTLPEDPHVVKSCLKAGSGDQVPATMTFAHVRPVRFTGYQAAGATKRRRPGDEARGTRDPARPRGLFSFLGRDEVVKTENSIDSHGFPDTLGSSMQRTPNAAKPVIFAFVARISLR